jgi:hypothetical protein
LVIHEYQNNANDITRALIDNIIKGLSMICEQVSMNIIDMLLQGGVFSETFRICGKVGMFFRDFFYAGLPVMSTYLTLSVAVHRLRMEGD